MKVPSVLRVLTIAMHIGGFDMEKILINWKRL